MINYRDILLGLVSRGELGINWINFVFVFVNFCYSEKIKLCMCIIVILIIYSIFIGLELEWCNFSFWC